MPKRRFKWWGTVNRILYSPSPSQEKAAAIRRLLAENPGVECGRFIRMVYTLRSNTQEGAAALLGIERRTANRWNAQLHFYLAEELGFVAKSDPKCGITEKTS